MLQNLYLRGIAGDDVINYISAGFELWRFQSQLQK
jgi:hypothetical protein